MLTVDWQWYGRRICDVRRYLDADKCFRSDHSFGSFQRSFNVFILLMGYGNTLFLKMLHKNHSFEF